MPIQKDVFIKNYLKALNNGDAAVFAGAGLSASSGCVNWKQLLKEIAEELELDIEKESDLVAVAQYYYNRSGNNRARLNEIIKDAFQTGKLPNDNHHILARLPISTYWTTNYNKLAKETNRLCESFQTKFFFPLHTKAGPAGPIAPGCAALSHLLKNYTGATH